LTPLISLEVILKNKLASGRMLRRLLSLVVDEH
jgi:hypothetical protein